MILITNMIGMYTSKYLISDTKLLFNKSENLEERIPDWKIESSFNV